LVKSIEQIVFLAAIFLTVLVLKNVYINNTDVSRDYGTKQTGRMMKGFTVGTILTIVFCILSCAGEMFYYLSLPYVDKSDLFSMSSVINTALSITFVFVSWYFIGYVKSAIKQNCKQYLY